MSIQKISLNNFTKSFSNDVQKNVTKIPVNFKINYQRETADNIMANYYIAFTGKKKTSNEHFETEVRKSKPNEDKLIELIKKPDFNPNSEIKNIFMNTFNTEYKKANVFSVLGAKNLIKPLELLCKHPDLDLNQKIIDNSGRMAEPIFQFIQNQDTEVLKTVFENSPNIDFDYRSESPTRLYFRCTLDEYAEYTDANSYKTDYLKLINDYKSGGREKNINKIDSLGIKELPFLLIKNTNSDFISEVIKDIPNEERLIEIIKTRNFNPNLKIKNAYMNSAHSNYAEANAFCVLADKELTKALATLCQHPNFDIFQPAFDEKGYQIDPLFHFMKDKKTNVVKTVFKNNPNLDLEYKANAPYFIYYRTSLKDYAEFLDLDKATNYTELINNYQNGGASTALKNAKANDIYDAFCSKKYNSNY